MQNNIDVGCSAPIPNNQKKAVPATVVSARHQDQDQSKILVGCCAPIHNNQKKVVAAGNDDPKQPTEPGTCHEPEKAPKDKQANWGNILVGCSAPTRNNQKKAVGDAGGGRPRGAEGTGHWNP